MLKNGGYDYVFYLYVREVKCPRESLIATS